MGGPSGREHHELLCRRCSWLEQLPAQPSAGAEDSNEEHYEEHSQLAYSLDELGLKTGPDGSWTQVSNVGRWQVPGQHPVCLIKSSPSDRHHGSLAEES